MNVLLAKIVNEPIFPISNSTIDLTPFLIMFILLAAGSVVMRLRLATPTGALGLKSGRGYWVLRGVAVLPRAVLWTAIGFEGLSLYIFVSRRIIVSLPESLLESLPQFVSPGLLAVLVHLSGSVLAILTLAYLLRAGRVYWVSRDAVIVAWVTLWTAIGFEVFHLSSALDYVSPWILGPVYGSLLATLTLAYLVPLVQGTDSRQPLRCALQSVSFCAFVVGLHPCACMVRDFIQGLAFVNVNNTKAFHYMSLVVSVFAFGLVWGRVFCGWVCPIGYIQEMFTAIPRALGRLLRRTGVLPPEGMAPTTRKYIRVGASAFVLLVVMPLYLRFGPQTYVGIQGIMVFWLMALVILTLLSVADPAWRLVAAAFVLLLVIPLNLTLLLGPQRYWGIPGILLWWLIGLVILTLLWLGKPAWEKILRNVRYPAIIVFIAVVTMGIYMYAAFCSLFTNTVDAITMILLTGVLLTTLILSQAWCRFLCPEGAVLSLLTRVSGWKINLEKGKCSGCNICQEVCPVEAIELGEVDEGACLYCCTCVDHCPTDALDMAARPRKSLMPLPVLKPGTAI